MYNFRADRTLEKAGRAKIRKRLGTGFSMLAVIITATGVQAFELGGFDVDMGTGGFEEENSNWDQDTGEETSSNDYNYENSDDNRDNTESFWSEGENSGEGNDAVEIKEQPDSGWEEALSTEQYENESPNSFYSDGEAEESRNRTEEEYTENTVVVDRENPEQENMEEQSWGEDILQMLSPTPTIQLSVTPTPKVTPAGKISTEPVSEISQNILAVPQKEEELPEEECRQKMQVIYCKKKAAKGSKVKICPNPELAAAVLSVRVNGKEADWYTAGGNIFFNMNEEQEGAEIETAVMCRQELSWTEAKKNAILTYNIF